MAAVVSLFRKRIPLTATAGGLVIEVWQVPTSTAGDTQTLALRHIKTVLCVVGAASYTAPTAGAGTVAITTLATVAASNFTDILVYGTE